MVTKTERPIPASQSPDRMQLNLFLTREVAGELSRLRVLWEIPYRYLLVEQVLLAGIKVVNDSGIPPEAEASPSVNRVPLNLYLRRDIAAELTRLQTLWNIKTRHVLLDPVMLAGLKVLKEGHESDAGS